MSTFQWKIRCNWYLLYSRIVVNQSYISNKKKNKALKNIIFYEKKTQRTAPKRNTVTELLEGIIESRTDCVSFVCIFRQQQQQHQQSPPDGGNGNSGGGYAFVDYSANSYYLNPIDLTNLSSTMGLPPVSSSQEHHQDSGGGWSGGRPLVTATTSSAVAPPSATGSDLDINVIKDRLMTTRVPESCVWPVTMELFVVRILNAKAKVDLRCISLPTQQHSIIKDAPVQLVMAQRTQRCRGL